MGTSDSAADASWSFSGTTLDPRNGPPAADMARLRSFAEVNEALKSRDFEHVTGRRDNAAFIGGSLLSLSGEDHFERRRISSRLFAPELTSRYEAGIFLPALEEGLAQWECTADGRAHGDLTAVLYRALSKLSATVVGLDGLDTEEALRCHMFYTSRISIGVNIEFVERDHLVVARECLPYVDLFRKEFFDPSWERRRAMVERHEAAEIDRDDLPLDLITLMLLHRGHFESFGPDIPLREAIFFNGASGGVNHAACNTLDALLRWVDGDPGKRRDHLGDPKFLRRAALEAIRVRPATPFQIRKSTADQVLSSGRAIAAGEFVLLDMFAANRDRNVFGDDADIFDPFRKPLERIKPTGLAFSNGAHTCIAATLSIGDTSGSRDGFQGLLVAVLLALFKRDVRPISADSAKPKVGTTRAEFDVFPVSVTLG